MHTKPHSRPRSGINTRARRRLHAGVNTGSNGPGGASRRNLPNRVDAGNRHRARRPRPKLQLRGDVLLGLVEGTMGVKEAAEKLGRSVRQVYRIKARAKRLGAARLRRGNTLRHGNVGRAPVNKISSEIWEKVIALARTKYAGVSFYELQDILLRYHKISVGRESLRKRLRAAGVPPKRPVATAPPKKHAAAGKS